MGCVNPAARSYRGLQLLTSPSGADWQEILIEAVRRRPVLWDISHIDFKDGRGVKRNNWVDVAMEVMLVVYGCATTGSYCQFATHTSMVLANCHVAVYMFSESEIKYYYYYIIGNIIKNRVQMYQPKTLYMLKQFNFMPIAR